MCARNMVCMNAGINRNDDNLNLGLVMEKDNNPNFGLEEDGGPAYQRRRRRLPSRYGMMCARTREPRGMMMT